MRTKQTCLAVVTFLILAFAELARAQTPPPYCRGFQNTLVSRTPASGGNGDSIDPVMSEDGKRIAFITGATNLVGNGDNMPGYGTFRNDILVWDRDTQALVSVGVKSPAINDMLGAVRISGDGRFVAFTTMANNVLGAGADQNGKTDIYVKELATGRFERISASDIAIVQEEDVKEPGDGATLRYSVDGTGRFFAFTSSSRSLSYEYFTGQDSFGGDEQHVYVRDRVTQRTYFVSKGTKNEQGKHQALNGTAMGTPVITADGSTLYFISDATNLEGHEYPAPRRFDLYRATFDPLDDEWTVVERIQTPASVDGPSMLEQITVSPDGRFVAFLGWDASGYAWQDIYVYDTKYSLLGSVRPPSFANAGGRLVRHPSLTNRGIVWQDSLDYTGEGSGGAYYRDLLDPDAQPIRIGRRFNGTPFNDARRPVASGDGEWVAFYTPDDLLLGYYMDTNGRSDVYLQRVLLATADCPAITLDALDGAPLVNAEGTDVHDTAAEIIEELQDPFAAHGMRGITADGAARVVLRATTSASGIVTFNATYRGGTQCDATTPLLRPLGGGTPSGSVAVPTTALGNGQHVAFAVLLAPADFVRGGASCSDRTVRTRWIDVGVEQNVGGDTRIGARALELHRPQVMLIHGIWSNSSRWEWEALQRWLVDIWPVDYRTTDGEEFSRNVPIVANEIALAVRSRNDRQIATARVDVFAHSMGAVITRHWAGATYDTLPARWPAYRQGANYQLGHIHRLVPLNSPQYGSELANILYEAAKVNTFRGLLVKQLFAATQHCLTCGAVKDLRTPAGGGTETVWNTPLSINAHAMVGQATDAQFAEASKGLAVATKALELIGIDGISKAFGDCANDGIVAVYSQTAGLTSTTSFSGVDAVHVKVMEDEAHGTSARDLLNAATATYFETQLPPGPPSPAPCAAPVPNLGGTAPDGGIVLVTSAAEIVTPGQIITVTLQAHGTFVPVRGYVVTSLGDLIEATGSPLSATITVPLNATGEFIILGAALNGGGQGVTTPALRFFIDANATLRTLHIANAGALSAGGTATSRVLAIEAAFSDDVVREVREGAFFVNGAPAALTFTSSDPNVATVNAKGVLIAQAPGTAVIEAASGDVRTTAAVTVLPAAVAGCNDGIDNDGDGTIDYPADNGCSSALDLTEITGATACDDGIDNDLDGLADLADPQCSSAAWAFEHAPPSAAFTVTCTGLSCTFDGRSSTSERAIASYAWTFGDGSSGAGSVVTHVYAAGGVRNVTLTVTGVDGQSDTEQHQAIADAAVPVARFTFLCDGLNCGFDASTSSDDSGVASYAWDFGDGSTATGATAQHTFATGAMRTVKLTVTDLVANTDDESKIVTTSAAAQSLPMRYVAVTPCRILDTRLPAPGTKLVHDQLFIVNPLTTPCGTFPNARAVSVTVAVVDPSAVGYLRLYATGQSSFTSAINFLPATSPRANNVIVPLAADGTFTIRPYVGGAGNVHVIVDISGYFTESPASGVTSLGYAALTPCRVWDTRLVPAPDGQVRPMTNGEQRTLTVQGTCGVPAGAAAAALNLTAASPTTQGYLKAWATGTASPVVSNLLFVPSASTGAISNGARVSLAASTPDLTVQTVLTGTTHVVADVSGYFKDDAPLRYHPITPCRSFDSRLAVQGPALSHLGTRAVQIRGNCGVPAGAKAAMLILTAIGPTNSGYITAWPSGVARPLASTISYIAGENAIANGTIVPLSETEANDLSLYPFVPAGTTHVVIDVFGYFD